MFIHGLAGDIARDQNGETGLIAGDIVDALPDAYVHTMNDAELELKARVTRGRPPRKKSRTTAADRS